MSNHLDDWIKIAHPLKEDRTDNEFAIDFCEIYEDADQHVKDFFYNASDVSELIHNPLKNFSKLIPCKSFEHRPAKFISIITQFSLYCSRDILVAVTQFSHLFGVLCGGLLTTYMLKYIEPRRTMLIGMVTV